MLTQTLHHSGQLRPSPRPVDLPELRVPVIGELPGRRLRAMLVAGAEALECKRVIERGGINLVSEVLRSQGEFVEYEHYPKDDVYDPDSRAQYYYHAHRAGEHGHFHTFLRVSNGNPDGSPAGDGPDSGEPVHLIAISMDEYGWPIGLFGTNHWVCGGAWRSAEEVIALLPRFQIDHAFPSWPVNRWIGAMMVLFRPHIEALLTHRDAVIDAWAKAHPEGDVFEDRELGVTGYLPISVEETIGEVRALAKRRSSI
jgi:hypothetical protein